MIRDRSLSMVKYGGGLGQKWILNAVKKLARLEIVHKKRKRGKGGKRKRNK